MHSPQSLRASLRVAGIRFAELRFDWTRLGKTRMRQGRSIARFFFQCRPWHWSSCRGSHTLSVRGSCASHYVMNMPIISLSLFIYIYIQRYIQICIHAKALHSAGWGVLHTPRGRCTIKHYPPLPGCIICHHVCDHAASCHVIINRL